MLPPQPRFAIILREILPGGCWADSLSGAGLPGCPGMAQTRLDRMATLDTTFGAPFLGKEAPVNVRQQYCPIGQHCSSVPGITSSEDSDSKLGQGPLREAA
jgi:hypothetical protein